MTEIDRNLTGINRSVGNGGRDWIVVHNVGTAPTAAGAAFDNTRYFASAWRGASAHYFIDEGDVIWQCVDDADTSWAVGDAPSRNGCRNSNCINVEVCGDREFSPKRRENLRWLVGLLMERHGIDAAHVVRHYDVTGKRCPAYYAGAGNAAWRELHAYITEREDDDMTPEQSKMLADIHNRITRTDDAGHGTGGGHDLYGRVNMIQGAVDDIHDRVTRTDPAGHDNPDGHDLYGRVNIVEEQVRKMDCKLDEVLAALKGK